MKDIPTFLVKEASIYLCIFFSFKEVFELKFANWSNMWNRNFEFGRKNEIHQLCWDKHHRHMPPQFDQKH